MTLASPVPECSKLVKLEDHITGTVDESSLFGKGKAHAGEHKGKGTN